MASYKDRNWVALKDYLRAEELLYVTDPGPVVSLEVSSSKKHFIFTLLVKNDCLHLVLQ
jgi:hypothetical protein